MLDETFATTYFTTIYLFMNGQNAPPPPQSVGWLLGWLTCTCAD